MNSSRGDLFFKLNRFTLYVFAFSGIVAAVVGTFMEVSWVSKNLTAILLFEISTLLAFLVTEFGLLHFRLEEIKSNTDILSVHDTPEALYGAASIAIKRGLNSTQTNKSIYVVSASGIPNSRSPHPYLDAATQNYHQAIVSAINNPDWRVRIIYHIENLERLERIYNYLMGLGGAFNLEARATTQVKSETIAPLIIGDYHVFFAQGDARFNAVRSGVEINSVAANLFARNYFDSLWQDPSLRVLRRATGVDEAAFELIRTEFSDQQPH